jgi:DNA-binding CsgD family transcriptional regulator
MTSPRDDQPIPSPDTPADADSGQSVMLGEGDGGGPPLVPLLIGILALVVIGGVTDLVLDRPTAFSSLHVGFELTMILASLAMAVVLWRGWWHAARDLARARATLAATRRSLAERQLERDAWRRDAELEVAGFRHAVDGQFRSWQLTPTEREVAFLLLQGHGHKQIAGRTGRSERTVRQHAVSVYQKSGLSGRAELAAYFLQDLMPADAGPPGRPEALS